MHAKLKELVQKKPLYGYICSAIVVCCLIGILYAIFASSRTTERNYYDTNGTIQRIEEQQQRTININKDVQQSINSSQQLNSKAIDRINRSQELTQQASDRINQSQQGLERAIELAERNEQIFNDIERRNKAE